MPSAETARSPDSEAAHEDAEVEQDVTSCAAPHSQVCQPETCMLAVDPPAAAEQHDPPCPKHAVGCSQQHIHMPAVNASPLAELECHLVLCRHQNLRMPVLRPSHSLTLPGAQLGTVPRPVPRHRYMNVLQRLPETLG